MVTAGLVAGLVATALGPIAPSPAAATAGREVRVDTAAGLTRALGRARPGDVITVADGVYTTRGEQADLVVGEKRYYGTFVLEALGTTARPIVLRGSRRAVIDGDPGGDGTGTQYGLYLAGADHVRVLGLTVRNVSKGIVADRSDDVRLDRVRVHHTGQEGIHLRAFSRRGVVRRSVVHHTGVDNPTYGEGIYVGSAHSNWETYSDGRPDASDGARILGNRIRATGAESIDVKEGTRGGLIEGNAFDGRGMTGSWADSWIDVKGNGWRVLRNRGTHALEDGFQVHEALPGWGRHNRFRGNVAVVRGPGYGFWVQQDLRGNVVSCDNRVRAARSGFGNVRCRR